MGGKGLLCPSEQICNPQTGHSGDILSHFSTSLSWNLKVVSKVVSSIQVNTFNKSHHQVFPHLKYSPIEVYRRMKSNENYLPTAAASSNKDKRSSVVWQCVTDIYRHVCLFLSTWNVQECFSVLIDNKPVYESTRPLSIYTKERWGKSVHVCTAWINVEIVGVRVTVWIRTVFIVWWKHVGAGITNTSYLRCCSRF